MTGGYERLSDGALVSRASNGDENAFAALCERYVDEISDFATWVVRDRGVAADVVGRTCIRVWDRLHLGVQVDIVKAWLFASARDEALASASQRTVLDHADPLAAVGSSWMPHVQAVAESDEIVRLVYDSAAALSPRDYSLLDLHLRRDLSVRELATALGLDWVGVGIRLSRVRAALEAPVTATLLARHGRGRCGGLDGVLDGIATAPASDLRWAIRRHAKACERCQESLRTLVSPAVIFAELTTVPSVEDVWATVWERVSQHVAAHGRADTHHDRSTMPAWRGRRPRAVALSVAAAGLGVAVTVTAFTAVTNGDPSNGDPSGRRETPSGSSAIGTSVSPHVLLPPAQSKPASTLARSSGRSPALRTERGATTPPTAFASERTFAWAPVPGAVAYEFHLIRADDLVFTAHPALSRVTLPMVWLYQGQDLWLEKGAYRWVVWPIMRGSEGPVPEATVAARLVID